MKIENRSTHPTIWRPVILEDVRRFAFRRLLQDRPQSALSKTTVSDDGLARLGQLHRLEQLDLRGTPAIETGVSRLKKLLPNYKMVR